ncbi:MAG TPA: Crp/Fnr family transcriptional regulator [Thermoanaerobaculia bacterium]|nr:Crp/Fnr family transcriptional regulator [Thermoanaerobaculia bacterium]
MIDTELLQTEGTTVLQSLAPYELIETWPAGIVLFRETEDPAGVYVLLSGDVDLVFASRAGVVKPLRIAGAGQILGLSCIVSGRPHDCSATTRTSAVTGFIPKAAFLKLLDENPPLWFSVLQMISSEINSCYDCMRTLSASR